MKTAKFYTKMLFYVTATFILMGCQKSLNDLNEGQTADSGETKEVALLQKKVNTTKRLVSDDLSLLSFNSSYRDKLYDYIPSEKNIFSRFDLSEINNDNLAGVVIYTQSEKDEVDFSDVNQMLLYVRKEDGFRTFLFENKEGKLELNPKYTFHSNFISSNDIYDLYKIISPKSKAHCYTLLNGKLAKALSLKESSLQFFVSTAMERSVCRPPCSEGEGTCIVVGAGDDLDGNWICSQSFEDFQEAECAEEQVSEVLKEDTSYSTTDILLSSYNFKYLFLERSNKGKEYIEMYYELSKQMKKKLFNVKFSIYVYQALKNDVIPICNKLMYHPDSNEILISDEKYKILYERIDYIEKQLNNAESSKILNRFKKDLRFYKNKTTAQVYNSFKNS
ncbi:hypothetical protein [Capnocytophaga canis]|uniref:hypothetical protein n=1 Tax=Capnocytophaga canis TaxID=1848903 RepID=UPI0015624E32|nr:hypothetical protein [Capnocytophaga canis]